MRHEIPHRRAHEVHSIVCEGIPFRGGIGRSACGEPNEVFLDVEAKSGSAIDILTTDIAVAASLALQHGCPLAVLEAALSKLSDNSPAGPLGLLLASARTPA